MGSAFCAVWNRSRGGRVAVEQKSSGVSHGVGQNRGVKAQTERIVAMSRPVFKRTLGVKPSTFYNMLLSWPEQHLTG